MTQSLKDRIALVTGASRGIGRAVALALAEEGAHLVLVARTSGALEELDDEIQARGGSATLVPMSLTDFPAIDRLGGAVLERWGRLDILVGNAGVLGPLTPLSHVKEKQWAEVMDVNVNANWYLIRSFDALMRQSDAGRAVFVTSGAAHMAKAYWGPYSISKAALDAMVCSWAAELSITKARANLVSPGPLRTAMRARAMPGEDPDSLDRPEDLAPFVVKMLRPDFDENGRIFHYPSKAFVDPQPPA